MKLKELIRLQKNMRLSMELRRRRNRRNWMMRRRGRSLQCDKCETFCE
jgi:hypothetical protein